MKPPVGEININAMAPKVEVDNGISLHFYYRIAENLLKQANIYREERNIIDLYIMLVRFSSLLCDTIPSHRDYQSLQKEKTTFSKKLLDVLNELESLKPNFLRQVNEVNRGNVAQFDVEEKIPYNSEDFVSLSSAKKQNSIVSLYPKKEQQASRTPQSSSKYGKDSYWVRSLDQSKIHGQSMKPSIALPKPKEETLSRHSILGPNGLQGQSIRPVSGIRVQYPTDTDFSKIEMPSISQKGQFNLKSEKDNSRGPISEMDSVLSLDDGRWSQPSVNVTSENLFQLNIRQPSPPPVMARVQPQQRVNSIPPLHVADPRPGPPKLMNGEAPDSKTFKNLHISAKMMECFLRLAETNTAKNIETCGILAGSLRNKTFCVTTLIIPKQEATSDYCQTTDEEEVFNFQDERSLFPLGWIHTHPTQTCFMSSVDLHTHYSYQIMLPEAIAIVMAPTDESRTHGIFHLSDPGGIKVIRNCEERGFHPHEEPTDGSPLYEHCSHVYMNQNLQIEVADLR